VSPNFTSLKKTRKRNKRRKKKKTGYTSAQEREDELHRGIAGGRERLIFVGVSYRARKTGRGKRKTEPGNCQRGGSKTGRKLEKKGRDPQKNEGGGACCRPVGCNAKTRKGRHWGLSKQVSTSPEISAGGNRRRKTSDWESHFRRIGKKEGKTDR